MTDTTDQPVSPQSNPGIDFIVTAEDIVAVQPERVLDGSTSVDCVDLHRLLQGAQSTCDDLAMPVFQLLAGLMNYYFVPNDRVQPFMPVIQFGSTRSLVPSDLHPEQIAVISDVAPGITNPGLRARLADVAWFMNRQDAPMGFLAVSSYCDCIAGLIDGTATLAFEQDKALDIHAIQYLTRAAMIAHTMGWDKAKFARLKALIIEITEVAAHEEDPNGFIRIARVNLDWRVHDPSDIAVMAEGIVVSQSAAEHPDTRKRLWETAVRGYHLSHKEEEADRCQIESAECFVHQADLAKGSAMIRSSYLEQAIQVMRPIRATKERRAELHALMREAQPAIHDEMGVISHESDITEIVERAGKTVMGRSLPWALLQLMMCDSAPDPEGLRREVLKQREESSIVSNVPVSFHDSQGRVVFTSPGFSIDGGDDEAHIRFLMARNDGIRRQLAVAGAIDPIRRVITTEHPVSVDDLMLVMEHSPFVQPEHEHLYATGALRFMGGADMEAAHLLIPQLENSLRYVLSQVGVDTTSIDQDGIQTEATLSGLLGRFRGQLETVMSPPIVHEIDLLFNFRGGPSVRNELAHGKVGAGGFWGHDYVYACWFILHLVFQPLVHNWSEIEALYAKRTGLPKPTPFS